MTELELKIDLLSADARRAFDEGRLEDARDLWLVTADAMEEVGRRTSAWLYRVVAGRLHVLHWARSQHGPRIALADVRPLRRSPFKPGQRVTEFEIDRGVGIVRVDRRGRVRRVR